METIQPVVVNEFVPLYTNTEPLQPMALANPIPVERFTQTETVIATLTIASSLSFGTNMVDVKKGKMTVPQAALNAVVKGVAATVILNKSSKSTPLQVVTVAGILAGTGFLIDTVMKKDKTEKNPMVN